MNKYIIMPEGCHWSEREAANHEAAYCFECSWYKPSTRVAVMDLKTGETRIFSRKLDPAGNLIEVVEHIERNALEV